MPINVNFDAPTTPPSSTDKTNFRLRYDAFLAYIQSLGTKLITFVSQINDLETNVNAKEASATTAAASAQAAANYKGVFIQGTSNASVGESWTYNGIIYKCNIATSINPITDPTKWTSLGIDAQTHSATSKSIPVDNDEFPIADSGSTFSLKKLTYANLKSALVSYLDNIYARLTSPTFLGTPTAPTASAGTNTNQIATTAFAMGSGIGSNQSANNVTASRAQSTTYTNSTGKPIQVIVTGSGSVAGICTMSFTVNGNVVQKASSYGSGSKHSTSVIVPNGATYSATNLANSTLETWFELS